MRKCARIVLLLLIIYMLYSCSTIKYVPVETIKKDTTYVSQFKVDSIYQQDSIYIEHAADTIFIYKYKYISKYIEKHDTTWKEKIDTIRVPYPVEAKLTKWQSIKINIGGGLIIAIILLVIVLCVKYVLKRKQ